MEELREVVKKRIAEIGITSGDLARQVSEKRGVSATSVFRFLGGAGVSLQTAEAIMNELEITYATPEL